MTTPAGGSDWPGKVRPGGAQIIPRPDVWRPGPPSAWRGGVDPAGPSPTTDQVLDAVRRAGRHRPMEPLPDARLSAVLIALVDGADGAEVLLTRRSWHLTNHKGEVSFPGGRMDPGETPAETALREAWEEVCLERSVVTVEGELDHLSTVVSRSYIVPVVARLTERPVLRPGTAEVERIFYVSLAELLRDDTHREERWGPAPTAWPIHFFELDDETIWGATARMLHQLLTLVYAPG